MGARSSSRSTGGEVRLHRRQDGLVPDHGALQGPRGLPGGVLRLRRPPTTPAGLHRWTPGPAEEASASWRDRGHSGEATASTDRSTVTARASTACMAPRSSAAILGCGLLATAFSPSASVRRGERQQGRQRPSLRHSQERRGRQPSLERGFAQAARGTRRRCRWRAGRTRSRQASHRRPPSRSSRAAPRAAAPRERGPARMPTRQTTGSVLDLCSHRHYATASGV